MPDGSVLSIWPVLCCVEGDIPWMQKLTNSIGHGGKRACFRCAQNGVWVFAANTVRYDVCVRDAIVQLAVLRQTPPHSQAHCFTVQVAWVPRPGNSASASSRSGS